MQFGEILNEYNGTLKDGGKSEAFVEKVRAIAETMNSKLLKRDLDEDQRRLVRLALGEACSTVYHEDSKPCVSRSHLDAFAIVAVVAAAEKVK